MQAFGPPVDELVVTEGSPLPERSRTHAPRLDPAEETDDGPGQVPDYTEHRLHSCGHSAGIPPASLSTVPAEQKLVAGTQVGARSAEARRAVKLERRRLMR